MKKLIIAATLLAGISTQAYALSGSEIGEIMYASDVVLAAHRFCPDLEGTQKYYTYGIQVSNVPVEIRTELANNNFTQIEKEIEVFGIEAFCYAAYDNYGPDGRTVAGLLVKGQKQ
jgi:hypothetical protein